MPSTAHLTTPATVLRTAFVEIDPGAVPREGCCVTSVICTVGHLDVEAHLDGTRTATGDRPLADGWTLSIDTVRTAHAGPRTGRDVVATVTVTSYPGVVEALRRHLPPRRVA